MLEAGRIGKRDAIDKQPRVAPQGGVDGMAGGSNVAVPVGRKHEVGMNPRIDRAGRKIEGDCAGIKPLLSIGGRVLEPRTGGATQHAREVRSGGHRRYSRARAAIVMIRPRDAVSARCQRQ